MNKKEFQLHLKKYMQGMEFSKIKSNIWTWLTHGFHLIILIAGILFGFTFGYYYQEVSSAIKIKNDNFARIRYDNKTSISLTDRNELLIIDKTNQATEILSDTTADRIWLMIGERKAIKSINTITNGKSK